MSIRWLGPGVLAAALVAGCNASELPEDGPYRPDEPDPSLHCPPRDPVDCAEDVGGWIPQRMEGTTLGGEDGYAGSVCGVGGGVAVEDAAFRFTAPRTGFYRFSTEGSAFDTILSVRRGSCAGREITCNDDAVDGVTHSALTLELEECETVTLVVDGYDATGIGDFALSVDTSEHACSDGLDDDGDGLIDCDDPDCAGPRCDVQSGDWPEGWQALERGVLEAVNEQRARGAVCDGEEMPPAGPLERDVLLEDAARKHSLDMAEQGYFAHESLDGRTPGDRIAAAGYEGSPVGENIAQGYRTVEDVMAGWMSSPGHCRNIMNPVYDRLGVGYAEADGSGAPYWTQNFGGL